MNNKDIEEDIKIVEEFIGLFYEFPNPTSVSIRDYEVQAIENILADRERLKKENEIYKEEYCKITKALDFKEGALNPEPSIAIEAIKKALIQEQAKANKYDRLVERIEERIKSIGKCYSNLIETYFDKDINMINTSCMSKREKEEFINKRNCLLVQKTTFEEILKLIEEE